jgi:teichuronic acid biosynthesis glycosyltransferase TuaC
MHLLTISSVYPSQVQPQLGLFVRERVRHVAAHCEVTVVAPIPWFPLNRWIRGARGAAPAVEVQEGLTVYHPRFLSLPRVGKSLDGILYFASLLPFVMRLHRRRRFDLIDAHFAYPDGVAAALLGKTLRLPTLITLRGDEARLAGRLLSRLQMRWALGASRVIAVSDSLRQVAARIGIDPSVVRVIPNGVDASRFHPLDQRAARTQLGLPQDRRVLLSLGALIERKGHHRVLEVLPGIIARRPDALFVIAGGEVPGAGPSYRAIIDDLVRREGLEKHVRVVPAQPHDQVALWLSAADVFCLATRWEGWCNALMEALACGVPVVTTRVGGNDEFVQHGHNGFLVPYWDGPAFAGAVIEALDHPWDRAAIAAGASARSWTQVAEQVLEEFSLAMGSSSLAQGDDAYERHGAAIEPRSAGANAGAGRETQS